MFRRLVLAEDDLLEFLLLFRKEDEVLQKPEQLGDGAKSLYLRLQVAHLLVFPVEEVSPRQVPRHAVGKTDRLRSGEEHLGDHLFGRLGVVAADLVHAEGDRLVLARVLALDHEDRDAVDQEDHVLTCPVTAVVDVKLLRHFVDVLLRLARPGEIAIVDERQIEFAVLLGAEEFSLIAQVD